MKIYASLICITILAFGQVPDAQEVFARASRALQAGDYETAESGFRKVLSIEPHNIGALSNLGVVYSRTHHLGRAIEVYRQALRESPKNSGVLLNLGLAYLKQDNYGRAMPFFRQLHILQPQNHQALNLLATCLVFGGQPWKAVSLLRPVSESNPDPATLYLLGLAYTRSGHLEEGKELFAKMLAGDNTRVQADFLLGEAYYDAALFQKAAETFQEVLHADPNFAGAHRELGKVYVSLRRNTEAEQELRLALQKDPEDASAAYFLGGLLVQTGRYSDAISYLEHARSKFSDSWAPSMYLGKAKLKLNENAAAVRLLREAADLNPGEPTIFYLLASALRASGREEEARVALNRVSELHISTLEAEKRALRDASVANVRLAQ